jgi:septum site-determining protein MinC
VAAPRSAAVPEPAAELKFGQVGIANLRLKRVDLETLQTELAQKRAAAPQLFERAPVVLDLSHLPGEPTSAEVRDILGAIHAAGLLPVGLAYGTSATEALARELGLPLFAKFRAAYEREGGEPMVAPPAPAPVAAPEPRRTPPPPSAAEAPRPQAGLFHDKPVRSGQQVYARGRDLILAAVVGNGAEVIADGSIHVYASLRGKAIAGAQGDASARIFCQDFQAELVSIAGQYRVFEDIPAELKGRPVQVWLEGERLLLAAMSGQAQREAGTGHR